jgi:hypothetical protein
MTKKETTSAGQERRPGPNPVLVLVALAALAVAIWFMMQRGGRGTGPGLVEGPDVPTRSAEEELADLGNTLVIGPGLRGIEPPGTTPIAAGDVKGMDELLDGTDVAAVIAALQREKIGAVAVDPSIAVRNPIPQATVRNRLALARPAGRLSARLISQKVLLYRLTEPPPELSPAAKRALLAIIRQTASGAEEADVPRLPELFATGNHTVLVTVRPVQNRHLSYHTVSGKTLADAARDAGSKIKRYWERKKLGEQFGPLPQALGQSINLEFEVMFDRGTLIGPRDGDLVWRAFEPGIHGIRVAIDGKAHYLPPWYSVTNNFRTVEALLERVVHDMGGQDRNYWKDASVPLERFRTVHWRERTPGGEVEDLYRAFPRIVTNAEVTRENLVASLAGLGRWIAGNQTDKSGRYVYRYFPAKDEENEEYNMVRHALGPFSMALAEEFVPDPLHREKAEAGWKLMEERLRWGGPPRHPDGTIDTAATLWMGKPPPGPDMALLEFDENEFATGSRPDWSVKLGAVAVAILGYTQARQVGWELGPEREKILKGLAQFLLWMQRDDGSFNHYYVSTKSHYHGQVNSIYPGEILYAVARLYGETRDPRYRTAFQDSMRNSLAWFKGEMEQKEPDGTYAEGRRKELVQFQPWIAMAMEEMHRHDPSPEYVEASNLVSEWILDDFQYDETRAFFPDTLGGYLKVLDELPAMHSFVYTEGTAASYMLARRAGSPPETIQKLRRGALLTARFILQMQVRKGENDYFFPNPEKAAGAVRYCTNHNKQRIDYTYHALSSVYRILHAATPEDYAFIQSIPMPEPY